MRGVRAVKTLQRMWRRRDDKRPRWTCTLCKVSILLTSKVGHCKNKLHVARAASTVY